MSHEAIFVPVAADGVADDAAVRRIQGSVLVLDDVSIEPRAILKAFETQAAESSNIQVLVTYRFRDADSDVVASVNMRTL